MLTTQIIKYINQSVLCWLATVSADGQPNVSPKEIFTNHGADHLLIANIMSPGSIRNIKSNPKVCVSFIDILIQKGYQLKGTAKILNKNDVEFEETYQTLYNIAGPNFPIHSVIQVKVESTKEILAPRYVLFPGTTEAEQIKSAQRTYLLNK